MTSYTSEKELRAAIPQRPAGGRNSTYCALCGHSGGSSIGNHTYSLEYWFSWWHCRTCGRDYDLLVTPHKLPDGSKSPFDKVKKPRKK